jgi:hypothetical protein
MRRPPPPPLFVHRFLHLHSHPHTFFTASSLMLTSSDLKAGSSWPALPSCLATLSLSHVENSSSCTHAASPMVG